MVELSKMLLTTGLALFAGGLIAWSIGKSAEDNPGSPSAASEMEAMQLASAGTGVREPVLPTVREGLDNDLVGVIAPAEKIDLVASGAGRLEALNISLGEVVTKGMLLAEIALEDLDYRKLAQAARLRQAEVRD